MAAAVGVGMVGAGWWASVAHLPSLVATEQAEIVGIVDPSLERAQIARDRFGAKAAYTSIDELLERDDLDAVIIATPHTTHFELVRAALLAGKHVLVEKPLTTTAEDAWELVRIARERDLLLCVGATYQYANTAARVEKAVREEIGQLVSVNGEFSSTTHSLFATVDPADANLDDPASPHGTTYSDPALGGGQGHTQLSHVLGSIIRTTGQQATEVFAYMNNLGLRVDVVDALVFALEGGALCTTSSTGTVAPNVPIRHRIRYHGTKGMVEHDIVMAEAWLYRTEGGAEHIEHSVSEPSYWPQAPSRSFVSRIRGEGDNRAPAGLAAAAVSLIDAAYRSAESGKPQAVTQGSIQERDWK